MRWRAVIVVAITRLVTTIEVEAKALAGDLGTLPYEQRLRLNAGVPTIVLATPDAARAATLVTALRERGHDVLRCDRADVIASAAMVAVRRPQLEIDALVAGEARVAWSDIAALVRATHRTSTASVDEVTQSKFSLGRAVITGGVVMTKMAVRTARVARVDEIEPVLYLFPRTGGLPWLLRERSLRYDALGAEVTPSSSHNFTRLVDLLRTRARGATYDERLVARRAPPDDLDVLAHLIASSSDIGPSPFR